MSAHCERIESNQNSNFKQVLKWGGQSPSKLKAQNVAVCEGLHLAQEILEKSPDSICQVWLPEALWNNPQWQQVSSLVGHNTPLFELPNALYSKLSQLPSATGPLIVFEPQLSAQKPSPNSDWVVLDKIQDPGNLGTMLRTCAAAGIEQVVLTPGCAWPWGEKALRAGMGAQWVLSLWERGQVCSQSKAQILTTSLGSGAISVYDCNLTGPTIWVFGNEGQGVSTQWLDQADAQVCIPQSSGVESLNVAASCAVLLFEQRRQRQL